MASGRAGHHACHQLSQPHSYLMAMAQCLALPEETVSRLGKEEPAHGQCCSLGHVAKRRKTPDLSTRHPHANLILPNPVLTSLWNSRKPAALLCEGLFILCTTLQPLLSTQISTRISGNFVCHQLSQWRPSSPDSGREMFPSNPLAPAAGISSSTGQWLVSSRNTG